MRGEDLTVPEAAEALGTSPQTVRTLLRKGQLQGERHPWGNRFVWKISHEGLEEFLSEYGRLDGHRRPRAQVPVAVGPALAPVVPLPDVEEAPLPAGPHLVAEEDVEYAEELQEFEDEAEPLAEEPGSTRPFVLRPRGRATVVVVVLGLPLLLAFAAARTVPNALWFDEVGQRDVFERMLVAQAEFRLLVTGTVGVFLWVNLLVAGQDTWLVRRRSGVLTLGAASLAIAGLFASAVAGH